MAKHRSPKRRSRRQHRPTRVRPAPRGAGEATGSSPFFLAIDWGEPKYLRKKNRIVLEGVLVLHGDAAEASTSAPDARISLTLPPDAIVRWLSRPDDGRLLSGAFADALRKAAPAIPYRMRRDITLEWIRECAASAYLVLLDGGRNDLRQILEAALSQRDGQVPASPRERAITLAAFLIAHIAFPAEWKEYKLKDPLADGSDPESFFKRYIRRGLPAAWGWGRRRREQTTELLVLRIEPRFWWLVPGSADLWGAVRPSKPKS